MLPRFFKIYWKLIKFIFLDRYKLHWWWWIPYKVATKVAEVTLFSDQGVPMALQISLCYWPGDCTRILVHGTRYFYTVHYKLQLIHIRQIFFCITVRKQRVKVANVFLP